MGDKGSVLIKDKNVSLHRGFETQLFSRTDGDWKIKLVFSADTIINKGAAGVPDGNSDLSTCVGDQCDSCSLSMAYPKAFDASSCSYDCEVDVQWEEAAYTRVHRNMDIIKALRAWQGLSVANGPEELGLPSNCSSAYARKFLQ